MALITSTVEDLFDVPHDVEVVAIDPDSDLDGWLLLREGSIGGSDASAVAGVNKYRTVWQVWHEKTWRQTGLPAPPRDDYHGAPSPAAYWGTKLEDDVAEAYAEHTGLDVVHPKIMYVDHRGPTPRHVNLDRAVYDPVLDRWVPLEIKTASLYVASDWAEGPADHAFTQVHHADSILGVGYAKIAVLIGGQDYRAFDLAIDAGFARDIVTLEDQFWADHVVTLEEPPPAAGDAEYFTDLFDVIDEEIELPEHARDIWDELEGARAAIEEAEQIRDRCNAELQRMLEGHRVGMLHGRRLASWGKAPDPDDDNLRLTAAGQRSVRVVAPDLFARYAERGKPRRRSWLVNHDWGDAASPT